ncbi:helix-turn-helix domain-containing protein [Paremcibacter congregatus]|uniref:TetR/AcrR family transcriptional regulator n=1 Tax=Paremcibacter congregatus TaxID=2043170 RepID=UPI0030EB30E5|tara:strand:+ start:8492 stop:9079 length:588 start_codon:yes stop_codon:yes gene_type:complete
MVRTAEFEDDTFIQASLELISLGGPGATTMAAIAKCAGAPTGSIYHRFPSRNALLGTVWHQALVSLTMATTPALLQGDSQGAVTALLDWAESHPKEARLILLYEESDLIDGPLPEEIHKAIAARHRDLGTGLTALLAHKKKTLSAANLALANFAIFDGPIAAMKPLLRAKKAAMPLNTCRAAALACARTTLDLLE